MHGGKDQGGMPFERMIAVLRYRGLDGEAMRLAQERQMETMRETAELLARTMQDIGTRQAELMRDTVERMMCAIPGRNADDSLSDLTRRQMDTSREQVEASLEAFRAIAELMWSCGRNAFELMNRTMTESVSAVARANGPAADAPKPAPANVTALPLPAKKPQGKAKTRH